jgi:hypothetical protein
MLTHLRLVFPNDSIDERGLHKYADTVRKKIAVHAAAVRTAASQQLDMPNVASRLRARQRLVRGGAACFVAEFSADVQCLIALTTACV